MATLTRGSQACWLSLHVGTGSAWGEKPLESTWVTIYRRLIKGSIWPQVENTKQIKNGKASLCVLIQNPVQEVPLGE